MMLKLYSKEGDSYQCIPDGRACEDMEESFRQSLIRLYSLKDFVKRYKEYSEDTGIISESKLQCHVQTCFAPNYMYVIDVYINL